METDYFERLRRTISREVVQTFDIKPGEKCIESFDLKNGIIMHFPRDLWIYCTWPAPVPGKTYKFLLLDYEGIGETEARIIIANDAAAREAEDRTE